MKTSVPLVEASVTLLPGLAGPRLLADRQYRPHIVIRPLNPSTALPSHSSDAIEAYLGVVFWSGAEKLVPGETAVVKLALVYYPGSEGHYAAVLPNAEFTVREGATIVGIGKVLKRDDWT